MAGISISSPSTTPVSSSQQQPTPVAQRQTGRPTNPGFWDTVVNFFKALFGARPTVVTSRQKLLVGEKFNGKRLDAIPDRMWKAVGTKQPRKSDATVKLSQQQSFELLERGKLISLFSKGNPVISNGVPAQMANWCNPLDQTHLGDFMEPGKTEYGDKTPWESVTSLHELGRDLNLVSRTDLQNLNLPTSLPRMSLTSEELYNLPLESGHVLLDPAVRPNQEGTPVLLQALKASQQHLKSQPLSEQNPLQGERLEKLSRDIQTIEKAMVAKKTAYCDPGGHAGKIKNALLPANFATTFSVSKNGLVMDPKTGLLANIAFNPTTREMAVSFTGNGILLEKVNIPNSIRAVCGGIPANFKHADQMIGALKEHVQKMNAEMKTANPDAEPITLHLTGFCMGGGVAAYVGGKHQIPFDTFNPMPLGLGLQRDMGREGLQWANTHGKRYVMETDFVSDANTANPQKTVMGALKCQSPGQTFVVPRTYVTRTDAAGNLKSDVHGLFRHMIENVHAGRGTVDIG